MSLEHAAAGALNFSSIRTDLDRHTAVNALVGWLYAITGPLAILLTVQGSAGVDAALFESWVFGSYAIGGLLAVIMSLVYRQPIAMAWSVPAVIVSAAALGHLRLSEVIGAYVLAGALIAILGATGWVGRVMRLLPMPIIMGMVCGVFLPFVVKVATGVHEDFWIAAPVCIAFVVATAIPAIARYVPPVLVALLAGFVAMAFDGRLDALERLQPGIVQPLWLMPEFTVRASIELVVPLMITVIGIHNPQGFAVLTSAKYNAPVNAMTFASGIGSIASGIVGAGPLCVGGPTNAFLCSSGRPEQRYVGGVIFGVLMILFGLAAPVAASLSSALPAAFIGVLGGLAMLRLVQGWLSSAFGGELGLGALVALLVTVSGVSFFHIAAPFWGLVAGLATSLALERETFMRHVRPSSAGHP